MIKFIVNQEQYLAFKELITEIILKGGWATYLDDGLISYSIADKAIPEAEPFIDTAISSGVFIDGDISFWVEVPTSKLDENVPATWPGATYSDDPEGSDTPRTFRQYTVFKEGKSDTVLMRCSSFPCLPTADNQFPCAGTTHNREEFTRYFTDVIGSDVSKLMYLSKLNQWIIDNVDVAVE